MDIQFQFDIEKTVQATAFLLKLNSGHMNYMGLLKMLYIADRKSFERMNSPITGDVYFSLDYGPVLSGVYDLIKGNELGRSTARNPLTVWRQFISTREQNYKATANYEVFLTNDPGVGDLCEEEERILGNVFSTFGRLDPFAVADWTHGLPEWEKPPKGSRLPISVEHILMYLQKDMETIGQIKDEADSEAYIGRVLNAAG